jgi:cytochrome c biogenesis protein CcmG, thiol:disulfide interchange protein DsbE
MRRAAVAAAGALMTVLTGCGGGSTGAGPAPTTTVSATLPPVALDPCPDASELLPRPATGDDLLPDLELPCLDRGPAVSLRRLGGRPTVVNLWASWCGPCRTEMPEFQEVYLDVKDRVRFLGVDVKDNARDARTTIQLTGVSYPSVVDRDSDVRDALGAVGMPTTYLVSAEGRVVRTLVGEVSGAELRAALRAAGFIP